MLQRIRAEFEKVSDRQLYSIGFLLAAIIACVSWTAIRTFNDGRGLSPEYIFSGTLSILGVIVSFLTVGSVAHTAFTTRHTVGQVGLIVIALIALGLGLFCLNDLLQGKFFLIGTLSIAGSSVVTGLLVPIILKKKDEGV